MNTIRSVALALSLCALAACGTTGGVRAPVPGEAPSTSPGAVDNGHANDNLNAVIWMQTAAEYEAATRSVFGSAADILDRALADPTWDALPREERGGQHLDGLLPAIIVDADETVIDNSPYQARLIERNETFDAATWREWTEARQATAIPGSLEFLRGAAQRGVTVFYVTNRAADAKRATVDNLKALGFPLSEPEDTVLTVDEAQGWTSAKGTRRQFVGERYRVLMMMGDNLGDFVDGHAAPVTVRAALMEPYRVWWGTRWFMLPNPSYGGWEGAITRDAADPNRAKRAALRTRY